MCDEFRKYERFIDPMDSFFETSTELKNVAANVIPNEELLYAAQKYAYLEDRDFISKTKPCRFMRSRGFERV